MLNRDLELTRRIDDEDAALVEAELRQIEHSEAAIDQLIKDLATGRWHDSSITDPMMPYVALWAYQNNSLSLEDFSTLLFFWSASQLHQLKAVIPDQPEFKTIIARSLLLKTPNIDENFKRQAVNAISLKSLYSSQMSEKDLTTFFIEIEKLPKSQQVIFSYDETIDLVGLAHSNIVTDRLNALNFSPLCRPQFISQSMRHIAAMHNPTFPQLPKPDVKNMIPSLGIMQTYLNVKFGNQAVKINPVLGLSSLEDIRQNGLDAMRDMALHFPFIKLPKFADGFLAEWFHFTWHDFYHAFAASAIPDHHRKLFIGLSDALKDFLKENDNATESAAIDKIINALIDMEHSNYRSLYTVLKLGDRQENIDSLFLITLTTMLSKYMRPSFGNRVTEGEGRVQLCKETTEGLFKTISHFILKNDKNISAELSENYQDIMRRNFGKTNRSTDNDKDHINKIFTIAAHLKHAWQKADIFTLFPPPKNSHTAGAKAEIKAVV